MKTTTLLTLIALAAVPSSANAGVITGRVVDAQGNPIANVNIDADGSGGPNVSNGGTDANGLFSATITPDGVYDLIFEPPPPPASSALTLVIPNVNVSGTVSLGDVALPAGIALSGRCVRAVGGTPVPAVNLDVEVDGVQVLIQGDVTNALGQFSIAVPTGPIELGFKTAGTAAPLLAPKGLALDLTSSTNLGDIALEPGLVLSAIIKRQSNGANVINADLDVSDSLTGDQLFTPGDNTDASGFVDVVLPAGTYDVEICPQFADQLVATTLVSQSISNNTFLGTVQLAGGVVLSGNVQSPGGTPQFGVDVDLTVSGTGASVTLCDDNTDAAGNYAVVVPTGTFDIRFQPKSGSPFCPATVFGVTVGGNTNQNGTLGAGATIYCTSKPSSLAGCTPSISAPCTASLSAGPDNANVLCGPVPGGGNPGILIYTTNGAAAVPATNAFGFLCLQTGVGFFRVVPPALPGGSAGTCSGSYTFDFGAYLAGPNADPNLLPGATIDAQAWYRDPANVGSANFSNAAGFTLVP